jgi:hypothetical protein
LLRVILVDKGVTFATGVYESTSIFLVLALDRRNFDDRRRSSSEFLFDRHSVNSQIRDTNWRSERSIRSRYLVRGNRSSRCVTARGLKAT